MPAPCLFLSHSGADTEGARELKRLLLEAPDARDAGLTVWFDKDDLKPGLHWQEQLEVAITRQATAFAVLVGSKGIINWVEREVRLGLARATGEEAIPFVSIVAEGAKPEVLNALPAFAQQHQGVIDPLNDPDAFAKLLDAILGRSQAKPARLTDEPFVGLRAMTEREADRFFGRTAEVAELVDDLRRHRLVAIVADSGAGKSSLAMAGLAPAFRGGALASAARRGSDDAIWHVVVMRPGGDPIEGLRRGVTEAAERMGLPPDARAGLRRRLTFEDVNEAAYALRCDLPAGATETLLIVDQFDELLTETPEAARQPFIDALLKLAAVRSPGGFYVVLTVRVDYFNLCRPYGALYAELQASERVLRLKRISDAGLEQAVRAPLRMAGFADEDDQHALATEMRRDLGDRPGDLALAQMALWTVWRNRLAHGGSLLKAYVDVGGVSGALAQEAEQVRLTKLSEAERALLAPLFVRLVRLGETGGVLRRIAGKDEFDEGRAALAEKLASDDHGRLLLVGDGSRSEGEAGQGTRQAKLAGPDSGGAKIEVCHEALITQWPWLQNTLNAAAADLRVLDRLMDRASTWHAAPEVEHGRHRATGAERELFAELGERRKSWLSIAERAFIDDSNAALAREEEAKSRSVARLRLLVAVLGIAVVALVGIAWLAITQTGVARTETARAEEETRVAGVQKARAEEQTGIAETQRARAEEETRIAGIEKTRAEEQTKLAEAQTTRAEQQTRLAETQRAIAEAQQSRADHDFSAAKETINRLIFDFVQGLQNASGMPVSTIRRVLDTVKTTIDALAAAEPDDRELKRSRFVMLADFASIYIRTGDFADAVKAATDSLKLARELTQLKSDARTQNDLSIALERTGDVKLQAGDLAGARAAYEEELGINRDLATTKSDVSTRRALAIALEKIGNVRQQAGDLSGARAAYEEELAIFRALAGDKGDAQAQRSLAITLEKVGKVKQQGGDVTGARAAYEEELGIDRLLAQDKGDAQAQQSLGIALEKIGGLKQQAGDLAGARAAFEEELAIDRGLARDSDDALAQRFLAIALEKIGGVKQETNDLAGARAAFEEELAIFRTLARNKGDAQAQQSLAIALEQIGWVKQQSGDLAGARAAYQEELAIDRDLTRDKDDAQAQYLLAIALEKVGGIKRLSGDLAGARAAYEEELAIDRVLARDKGDTQMQRSVAIALEKIGDVKQQGGDGAGARADYEEELAIFRALASSKDDVQAQRSLAIALEVMGNAKLLGGDRSGARACLDESLAVFRALAKNKKDAQAQRSLAVALERMGNVNLDIGNLADALAAYDEELAIFRALAGGDNGPQARLSLAIALDKVGNAKVPMEDRAGARTAYEEELAILSQLAGEKQLTAVQQGWLTGAQTKLAGLVSNP